MRSDLRAAIRALAASPSFTLAALVVLALGIGAGTAVFSVVDAVVLRGLPFDEHDRLVAVGERRPPPAEPDPARDPAALSSVAPQNYLDWAARQDVFEALAATAGAGYTLYEPGSEPEDLRALRATADLFRVLRIAPVLGRPFTVDHEVDGRHRVVVLSDALWRRRFGGDPGIIGRAIPLEGQRFEVIGVLGPDVTYPVGAARATDLYVPYVVPPDERVRRPNWFSMYLQVVGRLKPGVTVAQAQARMDQIAEALRAEHPEWNKDSLAGVRPLHDHVVGARTRAWLLMLLGAVGLVLLMACVNVATLQLARATARERDIGVRAALGASRWRLVRQLLVESVVLSCTGTVLAVLIAWWGVQVLKGAMPDGVARVSAIALDLRVLGVAALVAIVTGTLTGLAPAWQLSTPDLIHTVKDGARGTAGAASHRVRGALVVAEVALAVVLLVGAALFTGSFATLLRIEPGFDTANVITAQVYPRFDPNQPPADHTASFQAIVDRLAGAPGVVHASYVIGGMPLGTAMSSTTLGLPGREADRTRDAVSVRRVSPGYHLALRIPLRAGRLFEPSDRIGAPLVVIVNESVARRFFPGESPIGRLVTVNDAERTVVGVVGDIHQTSLETDPLPEIYLPLLQGGRGAGELVVRTSGDPYAVLASMKSAVGAVLPDVPLRNVRTMDEVFERRLAQRRFNMLLIGLFGVLGLVIAAVGLYGTLAWLVAERRREIGVRMAVGATPSAVVGLVVRRAGALVALGLAIGMVGAWWLSATAAAFLFGLEASDPRAYVAAFTVLAMAALAASVVPAHRAATVDPVEALRAE